MEDNCGFSPLPDRDEVLSSNLNSFFQIIKQTGLHLIVKKGMTTKAAIQEYVKAHPEYRNIVFYNCTDIFKQYKAWYSICKDILLCYAVKCNPDEHIMDLFSTLPGCCFDCASPKEIQLCEERNIGADRVIYANPTKSDANIRFMADHHVYLGTADCPDEIHKIARVLGDRASNCKIVIRLWVDDSHSHCPLGSKFGCMEEELPSIMEACNNHNMQVVGFAFHVGSGGDNKDAYDGAIARVKRAIEIGKEYNIEAKIVDVGGGFSGKLADDNLHNDWLERVSENIHEALNKYGLSHLKVLSEPGRYFNNYTMDVISYVTNVQERNGIITYRINDGVDSIFKDYSLSGELDFTVESFVEGECYPTIFIGPSGQTFDVIKHFGSKKEPIMLPRLKVGDAVLFRNMGAYTVSLSTNVLRKKQRHVYLIHECSLS